MPHKKPDPHCLKPGLRLPTRRETLISGMAGVLAAAPAVAQQASDKSPPGRPAQAKPVAAQPIIPLRVFRLRAEAIKRRLGGPDGSESTMFRLVVLDPDGGSAGRSPTLNDALAVVRGKEGEAFALEIENALAQPMAFHLRGLRGPNAHDGVPGLTGTAIAPGQKAAILVAAVQTGTFILAPVLVEHVTEQTARGLHAVVIVEESAAPAFDHDLVLGVSDWRLDEKGGLATDFLARSDTTRMGRLGNQLVANGELAPGKMTVRPGARLRVRMVNLSSARMIPLKIDGLAAEVYSIDSTPCQPFDPLRRTVILAPNSRIEMVLLAPSEAGKKGAIEAKIAAGLPIFSFETAGEPLPAYGKLTALPDPGLPPAIRLQDATRADFVITGGIGLDPADAEPGRLEARFADPRRIFMVNGATGSFSGKPIASLKRGRVLVLALHNRTAWPQVVALHGHAFRLLHPFDDGWEPYFLDTLFLAPNTVARIALIADNPGRWAIRSTIAGHFATGVAGWFEVA